MGKIEAVGSGRGQEKVGFTEDGGWPGLGSVGVGWGVPGLSKGREGELHVSETKRRE